MTGPLSVIPPSHRQVLTEALRAPSAHNAQPWRLAVGPDGSYLLHYNHLDYLPYDPDDRDAYLAIGAFLETVALAAQRHGLHMSVKPWFERRGSDLLVGSLRQASPVGQASPVFQASPVGQPARRAGPSRWPT